MCPHPVHGTKLSFEFASESDEKRQHLGVLQEHLECQRAIVCVHHPRNVG